MQSRRKYDNHVSLERKDPSPMSDLVPMFLRLSGMTSVVNENLILSAWDKVTGAGQYTLKKYVRNGTLICHISSSVVRSRLYFQKEESVAAINAEVASDPVNAGNQGNRKYLKGIMLK